MFTKISALKKTLLIFIVITCFVVFLHVVDLNHDLEPSVKSIEWRYNVSQLIPDEPLNKCLKHKNISLAFSQLMYELNIEAVLIEPSALYCLTTYKNQVQLSQKSFNISNYPQSENITRFALIGENIEQLEKLEVKGLFVNHGFQYENVIDYFGGNDSVQPDYFISHHFFARSGKIIHAVVLRERGDYFWLRKIRYIPKFQNLLPEEFRFYEEDTAYENFSRHVLNTTGGIILIVPEHPTFFLHQLDSAKFLECNMSRARHLSKNDTASNMRLEDGFLTALEQLKIHLQPRLINFFLYGGTLLGWYRQCGIIPYTSDVDFASWASDAVDEKFWIKTFYNHSRFEIVLMMGLPEEAFELRFFSNGTFIDLFFVYKDNNTTWISGHRPSKGYYFRYTHPMFHLCSADLLGHKVLVPCEVEQVILAEYGPNWDKVVEDWYYESSPKNMGPHIHWSDDKADKVFKIFW